MKNYEEYENDILKCSKCGLCKKVCPIWEVLKTEESYPRGKMNLLNIFNKSGLPPTKEFVKIIDMCAICGKCDEFCPSLIPCSEIFESFKKKYSKRNFLLGYFFKIIFRIIFLIAQIFLSDKNIDVSANFENNENVFVFCGKNVKNCRFFDEFIFNHPIIAIKTIKNFTNKVNDGDTVIIGCKKCEAYLRFVFAGRNVKIIVKNNPIYTEKN